MTTSTKTGENGNALLVTMMMLIALALLGMSSLDSVMQDQQSSGFHARRSMAFHAAEAGVSIAQAELQGGATPALIATAIGDTGIYPHGQPTYGPDPNATEPVKDLGATAASGMNLRIDGGGPKYQVQYWRFQVQGNAPGGTISRIEVAAGVLKGN